MASTASGSESLRSQQPGASTNNAAALSHDGRHPQAGPLPPKLPRLVGEIGYSEHYQEIDLGDGSQEGHGGLNAAEVDAQLGRHPADRSYLDLPAQPQQPLPPRSDSRTATLGPSESTSTVNALPKPEPSSSFFSRTYGGVTVKSIVRLAIFCLLIGGCIAGWVLVALRASKLTAGDNPQAMLSISPIFLHLLFAILFLLFLVFFERAVFRVRAERYAHVHPGQMLPSSRHHRGIGGATNSDAIAFAPWNRPPLPTYAAALGFRGTGDVEDAIIAAPPPPAYGNTRGSTLLLANLIRSSLRSMRSGQSRESWQVVDRADLDRRTSTRSLPVNYEESEHHEDARRAQKLADTLAQLEEGGGSRS